MATKCTRCGVEWHTYYLIEAMGRNKKIILCAPCYTSMREVVK